MADGKRDFSLESHEVLSMLTAYGLAPADGHVLEEGLCSIEGQIASRMPGTTHRELLARENELKNASKSIMASALTKALPGYLAELESCGQRR